MRKIVLESKFFDSPLSDLEKWNLIQFIELSEEGTFHKSYLEHVYGNNPPDIYKDTFLFTINNDIVTVNFPLLKKRFGISLSETKEKKVDINLEKINRILKAYNEVRNLYYLKLGKPKVPIIPLTKSLYTSLMSIVNFLEEYKIEDWYLYIYCLFEHAQWAFCWNLRHISRPACFDIYNKLKGKCNEDLTRIKQDEQKNKEEVQKQKIGVAESKWFTLYDFIERTKEDYLERGNSVVCMNNINQTLGYHPLSAVCFECPSKKECKESIQKIFKESSKSDLDIELVRAMMISVNEAKEILKSQGSNFDFYK